MSTKDVKIYADPRYLDGAAIAQIYSMAEHPTTTGQIAIMPDAHGGAASVIGYTGHFEGGIIPNLVGVDIGCGVMTHPVDVYEIDFADFDTYLRKNIPTGFKKALSSALTRTSLYNHPGSHKAEINRLATLAKTFLERIACVPDPINPMYQLGTLGGGNHFIEMEHSEKSGYWITVHSGSRNFGAQVAKYHQKLAKEYCAEHDIHVPKGQEYLPIGDGSGLGEAYLNDMWVAQEFAALNREIMIRIALAYFGIDFDVHANVESIHNWISPSDDIIRKGAIEAYEDSSIVIPMNMRDGIVLGRGLANEEYNFSAPHGSGRWCSRSAIKEQLRHGTITMEQFESEMSDVFSTSICAGTIDESPMAYKPFDAIQKYLEQTVEIVDIMKPVYNLKSTK